jgi:twinkle protein
MEYHDSLISILSAAQIKLRSLAPGHTEHALCPACGGGRSRDHSLAVSIDDDGDGATWLCHRGTCTAPAGGARVRHERPIERKIVAYQIPAPHNIVATNTQPKWLFEAFDERRIGARTLIRLGIYGIERDFPPPFGRLRAIVFPYTVKGEVVNRKYRSYPKQTMAQEKDARPTLYNVDSLGDEPEEIIFVEGEMDVATLTELGYYNAVSLKDGSAREAKPETDPLAKRFLAIGEHSEILAKAKKIILAGDSDVPGKALMEEIARRLGRHRCWLVDWPSDCKDASDVLRVHGFAAVANAIDAARRYPIKDVQRSTKGTLRRLREMPAPRTMSTGCYASDRVLKLPAEGRLIIVTGFAGGGKTTWLRFLMVHTADKEDRRWGVYSPEMSPWEGFLGECAEVWSGKSFYPRPGLESMSNDEIDAAEEWLYDRVALLVTDATEKAPTVDWLLERAEALVLQSGMTDFLVDPWNEVDQARGSVTETEFIGRSLQQFKAFSRRYGCNVWIAAHPVKPQPTRNGEKHPAPGPYDLAGSANWANKSDLGITLHSSEPGVTELHLWKSRYRRWGQKGQKVILDFDPITGRYSSPDVVTNEDPLSEPAQSWHDR